MNKSTNTPDTTRYHGTFECPSWCELTAEEHLAGLNDPREEWSAHRHVVTLLEKPDGRKIEGTAAQTIPFEDGDDESPQILIDGSIPDDLTPAELRTLAANLVALADTVDPQPAAALETARFTWRDLWVRTPYRDTLYPEEMARDLEWFEFDPELAEDVRLADTGGLLLWNKTKDLETGHLVMLTGQTRAQELVVLNNAMWLVNRGAAYSAERVGRKRLHDHRVELEGDTFLVWLIGNDEEWGA